MHVSNVTESQNSKNKIPTKVIIASTAGTLLSTGAYVYSLTKGKQGKNLLQKIPKVELGIKEGILLCTYSSLGGLASGLLTDKKENTKAKLHEATHQIFGNGVIPFSCLAVANKITKGMKQSVRTLVAIGTLFASTFLGHDVVDKSLNTPNKYKISFADFGPDIDDWVLAASTVIKSKALYKFTATVCPFTYAVLGIKTGIKQEDNKVLDTEV